MNAKFGLISESKKRMRRTSQHRLLALQRERSRWLRKQTIAGNKLARIMRQIDALALELATKNYAEEYAHE